MELAATLTIIMLGAGVFLSFAAFAWVSVREQERRASIIAIGLSFASSMPFFILAATASLQIQLLGLGILTILALLGLLLFYLPVGRIPPRNDIPENRFDERDIMFARARLQPGSQRYEDYYRAHPEKKSADDHFRQLPGLMSMEAQEANRWAFASAEASFSLTEALREEVTGPSGEGLHQLPPPAMTEVVKALTRYYGARTVGITELRPYHLYSHIGRGSGTYGTPIELSHRTAIAFTVEMDYEMMGPAPKAVTVMESARQYVEAAKIALQLCNWIRSLGHPARAHIDGNYRLIAPLVARDAGLGEIGRMGLLITPELGPRVRLGVVTTDLELVPDERLDGRAIIDFCTICRKCAENCPSRSIPFGNRSEIDGAFRWRIDADSCFHYWNVVGTDCGRCMTVCPYSHPDNWTHNLVRWLVARSGTARRISLWLDDLFYGRKPKPRPSPRWIPLDEDRH
ncbi:MAG: 4Fe-4S dicluster domain-containing protein [Anaerolineales bacterium]